MSKERDEKREWYIPACMHDVFVYGCESEASGLLDWQRIHIRTQYNGLSLLIFISLG